MILANFRFPSVLATAMTCVLGLSLILAAWSTHRHTRQDLEYPFGCDSYGYLQMARKIRQAKGGLWTANYQLSFEQSNHLIHELGEDVSDVRWHQLVAPQAHHYFPKPGTIGPQYPPGTSVILAAFPEGQSLSGLNSVVNVALLTLGLALMFVAARRGAWLTAACVALAALYGLIILAWIGVASYSINAMLVPVVLAILCTYLSYWSGDQGWRPRVFALAAGAFLGLGMLVRLPIFFLAPGLAILLLPRTWQFIRARNAIRESLTMFLIGLVCFGVLPVFWHQHRVAGAWHLTTYGGGDVAPPSLKYVTENARYYFLQGGSGGMGHSLLLIVGIVLVATMWFVRKRVDVARMLLAIVATWAIPLAYFLTHRVTTHYYLLPSTFATLWMVALCFFSLERNSDKAITVPYRTARGMIVAGLAALTIYLAAKLYLSASEDPKPDFTPPRIPQEFVEGKPWIWSEMTSGTIVYYANVTAFKVSFGTREERHRIYSIAFATGERQFLVEDCPAMTEVMDEIRSMGGTIELRGEAAYFPYYLIHWPPSGPGR